jgi:Cu-Zn family superoxide dismutase
MRTRILVALGASALAGAAAVGTTATATNQTDDVAAAQFDRARVVAVLRDAQGRRLGRVVFERGDGAVRVTVRGAGMPPGFHGLHVHAVGRCEAPAFTSAGPHWSIQPAPHDDHTGDLPSLLVQADGDARQSVDTDRFRLRQLLDADGSAVIVHANADNHANVPPRYGGPDAETLQAGDSGARIACGVVEPR